MRPARPFSTIGASGLVIASLLWGTTGTAASFLPAAVSPLAIGAATMTIGGLLLFAVSARTAIAVLRDRGSRRWLVVGAAGVFVYPLAFYSGMDLAGVAIGNVIALGSGPIFAALLEGGVERRPPGRRWAVATGISLVGIVLLPLGEAEARAGTDLVPGVMLGLLAGAAYATYTYASSRTIARGHAGRGVMGAMFGLGAIALSPVLLVTGAPLLDAGSSIALVAYLAIGPMFIAYLFFGAALGSIRSSTATSITLIEPVVATVLAILVVGERLGAIGYLGLGLILVGVTVLASAKRVVPRTATT